MSPGSWLNAATTCGSSCARPAPRRRSTTWTSNITTATSSTTPPCAPLFRTNVDGLRHVLDAAVDADLRRFVFTSTIGTIGIPTERRPASEEDEFNWADKAGAYVRSRVEAENLVMRYATERGLPAVAMCISNTYGPGDWQPTPHGKRLALAAAGKSPFYVKGWTGEVVGVEDAAAIRRAIVGDVCDGLRGRRRARFVSHNFQLTSKSVRLMHIWPALDHGKAERELGWQPKPIHESIRRAAQFYREHLRSSR